MKILGICSDVWVSSAALIEDGKIISAVPEERLNRQKKYKGFPKKAIEFCLSEAKCTIEDIDYIAVAWNPGFHIKKYNPRFSDSLRWRAEHLYSIPNNLMQLYNDKNINSIEQNLNLKNGKVKIIFIDHHLAHAANSFFLSPFKESALLSADGKGEEDTLWYAHCEHDKINKINTVKFPHSLGLFYGTFTQFLGFQPDSDEWKVMALASYVKGDNEFYEKIKKLITFNLDGDIELDLSYFSFYLHDQLKMYSDKFITRFGIPRRKNDPLEEKHYKIAHALQKVVEELLVSCLNYLQEKTNSENLVVTGGLFMNSVFNGKILSQTNFKNLFISSCPDDSGTSIGAALSVYNEKTENAEREIQINNYYGPEYDNKQIKVILDKYKIKGDYINNIEEFTAKKITEGKLIGWFQGKMEFGQRALGNRSIICDPRDASMKEKVNLAVKYRESFRPFAPSILTENAEDYFEIDKNIEVPFMEKVYLIKENKRKLIPAVTHVDGSGRLQTVNKESNLKYYTLIEEFNKLTGIPIILNTSFNLNGEPIVCNPTDAIKTFFSCGLDLLILGNYVITK